MRGHQRAGTLGAGVEGFEDQRRETDAECPLPDEAETEGDEDRPQRRVAPDQPQALPPLAGRQRRPRRPGHPLAVPDRPSIGADQREQGGGHEEGGGVDPDHARKPGPGVEQAAGGRADQPAEVVVEGVERVGRDQALLADQARQQGVLGRVEKESGDAGSRPDEVQHPEQVGRIHGEQGQQQRRPHHIGADHRLLAVPSIDEDAGDRAEEDARQQGGGEHAAGATAESVRA